ncbi:MAG: acylphosphatase [marine benthic group bacterium]|nr:acylphosphatase [Gemmatimonadota bacterium]MCL7977720.1 acylphosphatase [Gemmatimonadota bacterium]MCL7983869.1 acylphosphatase [Gemmatimonadota bacterium]
MHQTSEVRADYRVTGTVQGVGFRWWTLQLGRHLMLRGTVRNCDDGSVEVRVAGSQGAIDRLHAALREGSPYSVVEDVRRIPAVGDLPPDFRVER